jgi:osmoprotectant transport system ATP-binding protein
MIELRQVTKAFGGAPAVDALSLVIERGELVVLIGASGSGKSTTLKMINRLIDPDAGQIFFNGVDTRTLQPESLRRRMGYAIQSTGLFPHWTVARNIATVPALLGWSAARIAERVDGLLVLLGLDPALFRHRLPHQLSGGQQQRVGVARALAADPDVLLMDEPFGALDPLTRQGLQVELARIHRASKKTIVMVTHDIDEALRLASRIVLLDRGRIVQVGTPSQLLNAPATEAVSAFLGRLDRGLKLLALHTVADRMRPADPSSAMRTAPVDTIDSAVRAAPITAPEHAAVCLPLTMNLRDAMSAFVASHADCLAVVDAQGRVVGTLHCADLLRCESAPP